MKTFALLAVLAFSSSTFAAGTLLRCNIPWGELQEVIVKHDGTTYTVQQLNNVGSFSSYKITEKQWQNQRIPLKNLRWTDKAILQKANEGWIYKSSSEFYVLNCTTR